MHKFQKEILFSANAKRVDAEKTYLKTRKFLLAAEKESKMSPADKLKPKNKQIAKQLETDKEALVKKNTEIDA